MNKLWYRFIGLIIISSLIVMLAYHYHLNEYFGLNGFNHYKQELLVFETRHIIGFVLIYTISYIVLIACCVPGTIVFDLLAGFIYGPLIGTLLVLFSYIIGATLNFSIVRFLFKDVFQRKFAHLEHLVLNDGTRWQVILNLLGLRFIPVIPFWLTNILAAVLNVPLKTFVLTTFIGIIPTSIIYVILGDGVRHHLSANKGISVEMLGDAKLWLPLMGLALLVLLPNLYKFLHKRYFAANRNYTK